MNQKEAEKHICDTTNLAYWDAHKKKAIPLSNVYAAKLKQLLDESENNINSIRPLDSSNNS